jgi:DNA-binding transcriptional MerR regulator
MVGKLTTERDRKRLVDGLASSDTAVGVDKKSLHATIAGLGKRQFYIHSMYSEPAVIRSRHTLSWLRGPVTRDEIARLCSKADEDPEAERWRKLEAYTARLEQIDIAGQEQVAILKRLRARRPGGWRLGTIGMLLFGGRFGRLQAMRQANRVNVKLEQEIAECESRIQAMADEADEIVAGIERLRQEATCGV